MQEKEGKQNMEKARFITSNEVALVSLTAKT